MIGAAFFIVGTAFWVAAILVGAVLVIAALLAIGKAIGERGRSILGAVSMAALALIMTLIWNGPR